MARLRLAIAAVTSFHCRVNSAPSGITADVGSAKNQTFRWLATFAAHRAVTARSAFAQMIFRGAGRGDGLFR
jgi:hypothetical protein